MNTNIDIVVRQLTDEDKINKLEREREKIMQDEHFQNWCKQYNIGSRVEVKDYRAIEINKQYNWSIEEGKRRWPNFIQRIF